MSTYVTTRIIRGCTVESYTADNTEEEKKEIVQSALRYCAEVQRRKQKKKKK